MSDMTQELIDKNTPWELATAFQILRYSNGRLLDQLHDVQKIARDRTAEARGRRDHAEKIKQEVMDLHEPFPIFPVVDTRFIDDNCPHCGENVDDTYGDLHDEDSEGSQYVLCLTNGPDYLVCRECSNDGADEVSYPCNTLKIFGIKE